MRTPDGALSYLAEQDRTNSTAWDGLCEKLCRSAYGLPAHYSSANLHADAIPSGFRHGHEPPSRGDLVLYKNATYGHIVVATGNGWEVYTNDYGGRGKVTKTDARNLVSWCSASSWFVADAWWSGSNNIRTHEGGDVALSDEDLDKIAGRVWNYIKPEHTDKNAYWFQRRADANVSGVAAAVWGHPSRTLTSGGVSGGGAISDADVDRIATKVADLLSARLRA